MTSFTIVRSGSITPTKHKYVRKSNLFFADKTFKAAIRKLLFFVLCFSQMCMAQGFKVIYPDIPVNQVRSIIKWQGDTVFAAGANFSLMRSTDAGKTWSAIFQKDAYLLNFVQAESDGKNIYLLPSSTWQDSDRQPEYMQGPELYLYKYNPYTNDTERITIDFGPVLGYKGFFTGLSVTPQALFVVVQKHLSNTQLCFRSTDEGRSWQSVQLPLQNGQYVASINFRNDLAGIIDQNDSTGECLFFTRDGGVSWRRSFQPYNPGSRIVTDKGPIQWMNDSTIVIGSEGRISISRDTGLTWHTMQSIPWVNKDEIASISFLPNGLGYVAGRYSDVYRTTDWGTTWAHDFTGPPQSTYYFDYCCVINDSVIVIGYNDGIFARSADNGVTFDYVNRIYSSDTPLFFSPDLGFRSFGLFRTDDGGKSWNKKALPQGWLPFSYPAFAPPSTVYFVNPGTLADGGKIAIAVSDDTLRTCKVIYRYPGIDSLLLKFDITPSFRGSDTAFFFGKRYKILYTRDKGTTWFVRPAIDTIAGAKSHSWWTDFTGFAHQWVLRRGNTGSFVKLSLLHSTNDGATWTEALSLDSTNDAMLLKSFDDGSKVLLLYQKQGSYNVMKSSDAGKTWQHNMWVGRFAGSWYCVSWTRFLCVSNQGCTIWSSDDAGNDDGRTFSFSTSGITWNYWMYPPFFLDEKNGWIAGGGNGLLIGTTNGGITWTDVTPSIPEGISLDPIYPNPASSHASIGFNMHGNRAMQVQIEVYDAMGRRVGTTYSGIEAPGRHTILFDASTLRPGPYFVRLISDKGMLLRKMIVFK